MSEGRLMKVICFKLSLFIYVIANSLFCFSKGIENHVPKMKAHCPILRVSTEINYQNKNYTSLGHGWHFEFEDESYILVPYHVIHSATKITGSCPDDNAIWNLKVIGQSPVYDLSVLKIVNVEVKQSIDNKKSLPGPLFKLGKSLDFTFFKFPFLDIANIKKDSNNPEILATMSKGAIVFTHLDLNQTLTYQSTNVGPISTNEWIRDDRVFYPYKKTLYLLSGARPGLSGSPVFSFGDNPLLKGMALASRLNRGATFAAPLEEILPLIPSLISGVDPWIEEFNKRFNKILSLQENTELLNFEYLNDFKDNKLLKKGQLFLEIKHTNSNKNRVLIATELCSSSQSIDSSIDGGSTIGGIGGLPNNFDLELPLPMISSMKHSVTKREIIFRNIIQNTNPCLRDGILWNMANQARILIAVKMDEKLIPINSIRELLFIYENEFSTINKRANLITFINENGVFMDSNLLKDKAHFISSSFCESKSSIAKNATSTPRDLVKGLSLITNYSVKDNKLNINRLFEDEQSIVKSETPLNLDLSQSQKSFFYCSNESKKSNLKLIATNLHEVYNSPYIGNSYAFMIDFNSHAITLEFFAYYNNSKIDEWGDTHKETLHLKSNKIYLSEIWNHIIDIEGFKFYINLNPENKEVRVSLIEMPEKSNDDLKKSLLAARGEFQFPLSAANWTFKLSN